MIGPTLNVFNKRKSSTTRKLCIMAEKKLFTISIGFDLTLTFRLSPRAVEWRFVSARRIRAKTRRISVKTRRIRAKTRGIMVKLGGSGSRILLFLLSGAQRISRYCPTFLTALHKE